MSIEVKNLSYIYEEGFPGESIALDDISFNIGDGELVGIIGHTGSGKSTLLQQLNGLIKPKSGTIIVDNTDLTNPDTSLLAVRRRVGLVFQYPEYQLFEETVAKDVAYGPMNLGLDEEEVSQRVEEAIELVGLDYDQVKNASPFELSGGQKRRVAIAGVIAMKPDVLILDEPTAGLNPKAHHDILNMIKTIHERTKNIILLVSHNMDDIANMADRVLVMNSGKLVMNSTPEEIFSRESELAEMGLAVPAAKSIASKLKAAGMNIDGNCLTLDQVADEIAEVVGK